MASGDLTGFYPNPSLANSGVVAGTYGSSSNVAQFTINLKGLLTVANNVPLSVTDSQISGFSEQVQDAVGNAFADSSTIAWTYTDGANTITADLIDSGVTPGIYPLPIVTVNAKGIITNITSGSISPAGHSIYEDNTLFPQRTFLSFFGGNFDLADDSANNQTDVALSLTGVTANTYGSATQIPQIQVDSKGRLAFVANYLTPSSITGHTIQENNSSFTQRTNLSFNGTYFDVTDDPGWDQTDVTFASSGIAANTYGSSTQIPQIQFDSKGRALSGSNVIPSISSGAISDFNEAVQDAIGLAVIDSATVDFTYDDSLNQFSADLFNSGVTPNTYQYSTITVTSKGIITSAATGTVTLNDSDGLPEGVTNLYFTTERAQDAVGNILTDSSNIDITYNDAGNTISSDLTNTGIGAATYGSSSNIPVFGISTKGRFNSASVLPVSVTSLQISDFVEAVQDAVGNAMSDSGSIDITYDDSLNTIAADLVTSGVIANSYTNPTLTVDSSGRITSISSNGLIGGHVIQEDDTAFTQRLGLSFKGTDFDVSDDSANNQTDVNLSTTTVVAGTYGNDTTIGTFMVGLDGRLTSAGSATFTKKIGLSGANILSLNNPPGHGSTNTAIRWLNGINIVGSASDMIINQTNQLGFSCTISSTGGAGIYMITYIDSKSSGSGKMGISVNSNQLTTTIQSITAANRLAMIDTPGAGRSGQLIWIGRLNVNDVVRMHTDGTMNADNTVLYFSIARLFRF